MVWRWHFYAGLFCIPLVVLLAVTGSIYLFKPQVESWLDRPYGALAVAGPAASATAQTHAALAAVQDSTLDAYELPRHRGDAVRVLVNDRLGNQHRVYVHPQTLAILALVREDARLMEIIKTIHGELLLGNAGSIVVELAASWAIIMVVTGLYLWWPRKTQGLGGVIYPRLRAGARVFWCDLHAVTGVWVSFFALFLLVSALPWTNVWGEGLRQVRKLTAMESAQPDWTQSRSSEHSEHQSQYRDSSALLDTVGITLDEIAARAASMQLAPPVLISPPTAKRPFWGIRSMTQNRPLRVSIDIDPRTGVIVRREEFADHHWIDRIIGIGVAAHEGQLFGPLNQTLSVLTAAALVTLSVSAVLMWWRRRASGVLGAPAPPSNAQLGRGFVVVVVVSGVFLPVLGASLVLLGALEHFVFKRIPRVREWLGLGTKVPERDIGLVQERGP